MTVPRGLKLRAEDEADLQVLAACLQDALVPVADMIWLRDQRRFAMVVNRFMWEVPPESVEPDEDGAAAEVHSRTHAILSIQNVTSVRLRGIDQRRRGETLSLLSLRADETSVDMEFGGGGTIRIEVDRLDCYLEDVGSPWPTAWRPSHPDTEAEAEAAAR